MINLVFLLVGGTVGVVNLVLDVDVGSSVALIRLSITVTVDIKLKVDSAALGPLRMGKRLPFKDANLVLFLSSGVAGAAMDLVTLVDDFFGNGRRIAAKVTFPSDSRVLSGR